MFPLGEFKWTTITVTSIKMVVKHKVDIVRGVRAVKTVMRFGSTVLIKNVLIKGVIKNEYNSYSC